MGGSQGKAAEPTRVLPAGPEVSPTFPRRTRAVIPNATRRLPHAVCIIVETHLCTDSRADSRLNHGEVDFEWFARLRRKCFVSKSLNLNINRGRLWSAFIRQMILSDVNVPKIGESDLRDIVVGSVELKPYDHTYYHGYTQQRGMLRLEVVFNDDLTVGISSEIKDEICSKLESAVQALKSRISRICGINELERRTRRTRI